MTAARTRCESHAGGRGPLGRRCSHRPEAQMACYFAGSTRSALLPAFSTRRSLLPVVRATCPRAFFYPVPTSRLDLVQDHSAALERHRSPSRPRDPFSSWRRRPLDRQLQPSTALDIKRRLPPLSHNLTARYLGQAGSCIKCQGRGETVPKGSHEIWSADITCAATAAAFRAFDLSADVFSC